MSKRILDHRSEPSGTSLEEGMERTGALRGKCLPRFPGWRPRDRSRREEHPTCANRAGSDREWSEELQDLPVEWFASTRLPRLVIHCLRWSKRPATSIHPTRRAGLRTATTHLSRFVRSFSPEGEEGPPLPPVVSRNPLRARWDWPNREAISSTHAPTPKASESRNASNGSDTQAGCSALKLRKVILARMILIKSNE